MTANDLKRINELDEKLTTSYKLTRLFGEYLERYPTLLTSEIIDELLSDSDLSKEEAIIALLTNIFSLDYENEADRYIIRHLLPRSIKVLDIKNYTENEYYKNIAPGACKINNWEIRWESYPAYRAFIRDDMITLPDMTEVAPLGFFDEEFRFPAVLEDGNEWMTLTPIDVDTVTKAIEEASGNVITFGLGLGYYTYMVSRKESVKKVTVIEKNPDVIKLFYDMILPRFEDPSKIEVINADAFMYAEFTMPKGNFDYAFVDTWRDASDGLIMYEKMKKLEPLSPNTKFSYWIENFILSRKRSLAFSREMALLEENSPLAVNSYDELIRRINE